MSGTASSQRHGNVIILTNPRLAKEFACELFVLYRENSLHRNAGSQLADFIVF